MKNKPTLLDVLTHSSITGNRFIDSADLFEDSEEIHIEHGRDKYILKINDQDELELSLDTYGLH